MANDIERQLDLIDEVLNYISMVEALLHQLKEELNAKRDIEELQEVDKNQPILQDGD